VGPERSIRADQSQPAKRHSISVGPATAAPQTIPQNKAKVKAVSSSKFQVSSEMGRTLSPPTSNFTLQTSHSPIDRAKQSQPLAGEKPLGQTLVETQHLASPPCGSTEVDSAKQSQPARPGRWRAQPALREYRCCETKPIQQARKARSPFLERGYGHPVDAAKQSQRGTAEPFVWCPQGHLM